MSGPQRVALSDLLDEKEVGVKTVNGVHNLRVYAGAEAAPTDGVKNNASFVLGYTGDDLTTITMTIGANSYQKTLTWTTGKLTGVSVWTAI